MGKPVFALACACVVAAFHAGAPIAAQEPGSVLREQEIASGTGGFGGVIDDVDHFGRALAALEDLDGDGVGDLAVGAPDDDDGGASRGALWILFLQPAGTVRAQAKISGTQGGFPGPLRNGDRFGCSVAALGDLDGNGTREVAVGAEMDDDGGPNRGAVWVLSLAPSGAVVGATKVSQLRGGFTGTLRDGDRFGFSLAALDDLDGDGVRELAVGANLDRDGGTGRGAVWVLFLNTNGSVKGQAKISSTSGSFAGPLDNDDRFGSSLAQLGDLDGDGRAELAVGADQDDDGGTNSGGVWILFLEPNGSVRQHAKLSGGTAPPLVPHDHFGASLAMLGDVDGNGTDDLAVGAPLDDDGGLNCGATWILCLNSGGGLDAFLRISASSGGLVSPPAVTDQFGIALAALGDLDGDLKLDLAVGSEGDDTGGRDRGSCRILFLETAEASSLVIRNGLGINPLLLSAEREPVLGSPWEVTVDCTGFHRGVVFYRAVDEPLDGPVRGHKGQLLIDWRRPAFMRSLVGHRGAVLRFDQPVPADPSLAGRLFFSQAIVTGRGGTKLTNALDGEF